MVERGGEQTTEEKRRDRSESRAEPSEKFISGKIQARPKVSNNPNTKTHFYLDLLVEKMFNLC